MRRVGLALDGMYSRQEMEQFVREAEDRGLDSLWIDEGILRDAVSVLAAVAVQSHTIRLATGILNVFSRTPLLLAMTAASLDELSNGRFILGLGAAHKPLVEQLHGLSFGQPLERVRDYVAIIRQVVAGQKVTYQGKTAHVQDLRMAYPAPRKRIPLYLAALRFQMARLAGEIADGIVMNLVTADHVRRVREAVAEGARASGRDPQEIDIACFVLCTPGDSPKERELLVRLVSRLSGMTFYRNLLIEAGFHEEVAAMQRARREGGGQAAAQHVSQRMLETLSVATGLEELRAKAHLLHEAGVNLVLPYPSVHPDDSPMRITEVIQAVAP